MTKRALCSVSDKTGIVELAKCLIDMGMEIVATSGTAAVLREAAVPVLPIYEATGFPECLGGGIKTLHHKIIGGIMANRDDPDQMAESELLDIALFDVVVCNLYPFKQVLTKGNIPLAEGISNIDIGGPTVLRSAALNYSQVVVLTNPADYPAAIEEWTQSGDVSLKNRFRLAYKAFEHTSHHETLIQNWFRSKLQGEMYPDTLTLTFDKVQDMRYGENPHQSAAFYREVGTVVGTIADVEQLSGKALGYNNIKDADSAITLIKEFEEPTAVAINHTSPCGVCTATTAITAFRGAAAADPVSIFGGVVALNRPVDVTLANEIEQLYLDVLIAPDFTDEARNILNKKKNMRLLKLAHISLKSPIGALEIHKVGGGLLAQQIDTLLLDDKQLTYPTKRRPTGEELAEMRFAMKVVKHAKSNAVVLSKNRCTVGIGAGQTSRINAVRLAISLGGEHVKDTVMASDAFLSFADTVDAAAAAGITAIMQPGGSIHDAALVEACDLHGIAMVFTGIRHVKH